MIVTTVPVENYLISTSCGREEKMKNTWRKLMAALCVASLLITLPGVSVYAAEGDFFEEPAMAAEAVEQSGDIVAPTETLEEPAEAIDPAEVEVDASYPEDTEDAAETVDLPMEYDLPSEDIPAEETAGSATYKVGDGVYAIYDSETGGITLYSAQSDGGTLWSDWLERAGISRYSVKSIKVVQRFTVYRERRINLPADCRGTVFVDGDEEPRLFGSLYNLTDITLYGFETTNVTDMSYMFDYCQKLTTLDLHAFITSNVTSMRGMFRGCSSLKSIDMDLNNTSKVTDMRDMFYGCSGFTTLDLRKLNTSNVTNMEDMFYGCENLKTLNLSSFNTSKVKNMHRMFGLCEKLTSLDLSGFKTTNLTNMGDMFYTCSSLKTIDLGSFNTSKVTTMSGLFLSCNNLTKVNLSSFNTSRVTDMSYMFEYCESLKNVDVSSFDTSKVTDMSFMFQGCDNLTDINLSSFNTPNLQYMACMFMDCSNLARLDLRSFTTSKVVDMNALFTRCKKLKYLDIGSFDMSHVNGMMGGFFKECNALELLITPNKIKTNNGSEFVYVMYDRNGNKYSKLPSTAGSKVLGRTKALAASIFLDVRDPSHPFYNAIYWAVEKGITKGYSDGTFGIDKPCTRGEMVMFLWRYAGQPNPTFVTKSPFKDVPTTHAFYKAILWAYQKGITKGYSDGTFGINRNVTRGESMMFLWRLKGKPEPTPVSVSPFKDVPKIHAFYKAILWGYQKGITTGYTSGPKKGTFGIDENCTRGQIVTFLYRAK